MWKLTTSVRALLISHCRSNTGYQTSDKAASHNRKGT